MVLLSKLFLVLGFCVAAVGAAGFSQPVEKHAWLYFGAGMAVVALGGGLHRFAERARARGHGGEGGAPRQFRRQVETVRDIVREIDDHKHDWPPEEVRRRIDALLRQEYFDLASRNEDWIAVLGFACYARAWDGVAVAERLLSRAWSMATDGFPEEGFAELPIAREQLERAAREALSVDSGPETAGAPATGI